MQNQSISLSQEQSLQMILAPQLRQSLEMLQAPVMELRNLIRAETEQNPTLEVLDEVNNEPLEIEPNVQRDSEEALLTGAKPESSAQAEPAEMDFSRELEILNRMDRDESRYYFQHVSPEAEDRRQHHYDSITQPVSFQEHLLEQLEFSEMDAEERAMGKLIIGNIDDRGYMVAGLEEITSDSGYSAARMQRVLRMIQQFDPPGIAAADLRECLLLQLRAMNRQRSLEYRIVDKHLDLLAAHKFKEMAKRLDAPPEKVNAAAQFIATLQPRPGDVYNVASSPLVVPEVFIRRSDDGYTVELHDEHLPRLRISPRYERMLRSETTAPEVKQYIAERIRSAGFIIESIGQRQRTLRGIAQEIVNVQTPFFDRGLIGLRPLTMAAVAEKVGVHETTVSRAVAGKYAETPRGVLALKFFFVTGVKMRDGAEVSNKFIQDIIADMISREDTGHPLSDQNIVDRLRAEGYNFSRRTATKYRMIMKIPPSHQRRTGR